MPRLRVHCLSMSLDGFVAGRDQSIDDPLGLGGLQLHDWMFATRFGRRMDGDDSGGTGVDDDLVAAGFDGIGAWILGRNMFGPIRGPWLDDEWKGWWGDDPPYHCPVFVLTHHPRAPLEMAGGNVFHFVDGSVEDVLQHAYTAAGGLDVRLGGGAATVRQFMAAGLIDSLHIAIIPVLLGSGERLFEANGGQVDPGFERVEYVPSTGVAHWLLERRS